MFLAVLVCLSVCNYYYYSFIDHFSNLHQRRTEDNV